ncbi:835_t:CDS:2 [Entrophospora sp. SA101]|nr:835_t:CDS:2 [Entrophospora sp. SA101]
MQKPCVGSKKQVAGTSLEAINNPLRYSQVNLYTILQHCHSYKDPPLYRGNPYTIYNERYLEEHVVLELVKEAKKLDPYFPKEKLLQSNLQLLWVSKHQFLDASC